MNSDRLAWSEWLKRFSIDAETGTHGRYETLTITVPDNDAGRLRREGTPARVTLLFLPTLDGDEFLGFVRLPQ